MVFPQAAPLRLPAPARAGGGVGERGWTPDEFERWFAETMRAQLLAPRP
jgi:hypothetical protein